MVKVVDQIFAVVLSLAVVEKVAGSSFRCDIVEVSDPSMLPDVAKVAVVVSVRVLFLVEVKVVDDTFAVVFSLAVVLTVVRASFRCDVMELFEPFMLPDVVKVAVVVSVLVLNIVVVKGVDDFFAVVLCSAVVETVVESLFGCDVIEVLRLLMVLFIVVVSFVMVVVVRLVVGGVVGRIPDIDKSWLLKHRETDTT